MATPFSAMLRRLSHQRGVTAALLVSEQDGIVVAAYSHIGLSEDRVAALAASLYRKARLSARAAGLGAVSFMHLEAPAGRLCAAGAGELVLVVVAASAVNVGMIRVELLRAATELGIAGGGGSR